jgi:hypothetical protein
MITTTRGRGMGKTGLRRNKISRNSRGGVSFFRSSEGFSQPLVEATDKEVCLAVSIADVISLRPNAYRFSFGKPWVDVE